MLWLDTSWVPDLTYIFRPHPSLFIVIFSTWTSFYHYFSISHTTTCDICSLSFPFLIDYSTLSLFHLKWWFFTRHCMEDCHILSYHSPHEQWFRDVILRGCLVSEASCYIRMWRVWSFGYAFSWEFIHYWSEYAQKEKKKECIVHFLIFHWAHVWMC